MNIPRLFQLIDQETGENIALYMVIAHPISDNKVEELIKENHENDLDDKDLEDNGIIRVFVTEIYS